MVYAIPKELIERTEHEWLPNQVLRIYNKNSMNWQEFHHVTQAQSFSGYYGQSEGLDTYFGNVIMATWLERVL